VSRQRQAERGWGVGPVQACVCGSERARATRDRRVRALAPGERGSWAETGVGASTAQIQAA
jgi:hypothetical protein